jgi:hypothetical protein
VSELFERHRARLEKAIDACEKRYAWTAFTESPSSKVHGKDIPADIDIPGTIGSVGEEVSPFTEMPLGITYPQVDVDTLFEAVKIAQASWSLQPTEERVGLCLEILERLAKPEALFLNAHATVHTAGQSFIMAFAGCGANALDRGLEALAYAYKAMKDVPETAGWQRRFGATAETRLEKSPREKVSFDAARHLDRDYLCHVSAMERISGHTCEPLDGQPRDRQAASQNDAAGRTFRSHDARGPRRIWI